MAFIRFGLMSKALWKCGLTGHSGQPETPPGGGELGRGDIPERLSFDNIIAARTNAPCTTRDFMNYLQFVQYSAENLQFYLWLIDYEKRWNTLGQDKQELSPPWDAALCPTSQCSKPALKSPVAEVAWNPSSGFDCKSTKSNQLIRSPSKAFIPPGENKSNNPFYTPASSQSSWKGNGSAASVDTLPWSAPGALNPPATSVSTDAIQGKWESTQPFREEMSRILALYISTGSPRELNITAREREQLLHALTHTTHPSAFAQLKSSIEWTLRHQSHPSFIHWSLCNGSKARVIFARGIGVLCMLGGLAIALWAILSSQAKGWRAFAAFAWFVGITLLLAAWNGICPILQGFHHRHLRPWELWEDVDSEVGLEEWKSMDLTTKDDKSHEDRPWQSKYSKRNIIRKVFEREVWVEEPALRRVQDLLFFQSFGSGLVIGAILCGILMAIPK